MLERPPKSASSDAERFAINDLEFVRWFGLERPEPAPPRAGPAPSRARREDELAEVFAEARRRDEKLQRKDRKPNKGKKR